MSQASASPSGREPIAIVGIGCRFAKSPDPEAFWQLLSGGRSGIQDVSTRRWSVDRLFDPDPTHPGKMFIRWGGMLDDVERFDWRAFRISPREAKFMDPQHRLLMEVGWEAVEDAGIPFPQLAGSSTGVFVGLMWNDYAKLQARNYNAIEGYSGTGSLFGFSANRLSYFFDLRGPSFAMEVQCASSMYALHFACRSIWSGECTQALAGGVNLALAPDTNIIMCKAGIVSPTGGSKTFDARADGFARGEGAGLVFLKPLRAAEASGDRIYAVIRGSAVTNSGHSEWIMTPSVGGQQATLEAAIRDAGVDAADIDYVELHGTGTRKGDPIEARALANVIGAKRAKDRPLRVGSVKTNIGHLDSAAGVAGVIKTSLALQHAEIPASLNFEQLNPDIPLDALNLKLQTSHERWPDRNGPRFAGVTSLGFGGGNAHMVLQSAPEPPVSTTAGSGPWLLPLSAHSEIALQAYASRMAGWLEQAERPLADVLYTAALRRTHRDRRLVVAGRSAAELAEGLRSFAKGVPEARVAVGVTTAGQQPAFVFSGQGPQWWAMGRQLLEQEPLFRAAIDEVDAAYQKISGRSVLAELLRDEASSQLSQTELAQPALFAIQMGLARLFLGWGVQPKALVGHSIGEVAACHLAGVLSLEEAVLVVHHRGRLMQQATGTGGMAQFGVTEEKALELIAPFGSHLSAAAINGPSTTVISGENEALAKVLELAERSGVSARKLPVQYAFHSAQMEPFRQALVNALAPLQPKPATVPLVSTVTGKPASATDYSAEYWGAQLVGAVRFAAAIETLQGSCGAFLELSPHPVLGGSILQQLRASGSQARVLASLTRGSDEGVSTRVAAGALHCLGSPLDWSRLAPTARCTTLPTYAFQGERMWIETEDEGRLDWVAVGGSEVSEGHPLLGPPHLLANAAGTRWYEVPVEVDDWDFIRDHLVQGVPVFPGVGYLEMALAAGQEALETAELALEEVEFRASMPFLGSEGRRVQLLFERDGEASGRFRIFSRGSQPSGGWTLHALGRVVRAARDEWTPTLDPVAFSGARSEGADRFHAILAERGEDHGPAVRSVQSFSREGNAVLARYSAPASIRPKLERFRLHPGLVTSALHTLVAAMPDRIRTGSVPVRIGRVELGGPIRAEGQVRGELREKPNDSTAFQGTLEVLDNEGGLSLRLRELSVQVLDASTEQTGPDQWLYTVLWPEVELPTERPFRRGERILLLDDGRGVGEALATRLGTAGVICERVAAPARADAQSLQPLLDRARTFDRIVHLWSLDAPASFAAAAELESWMGRTSESARAFAVAALGAPRPVPLTLVTRGAVQVLPMDPVSALPSTLWGLGRTLAVEGEATFGGLVDLDPGAAEASQAEALWRALQGPAGEQLAFREGTPRGARLSRAPRAGKPRPLFLSADGTYLITGGLGGLGLLLARLLIDRGARHLMLVGQTPLPPRSTWRELPAGSRERERAEAILALERAGASVQVVAVDVGDEAQMKRLLELHRTEQRPPLRGVIHAAGVAQMEALAELSAESLRRVLRPKVQGAFLLDRLVTEPLDFFVLFGSASAVLSSPLFAHYAAGNAYLDALACARRGRGLPALSIGWGAWAEVGMAARYERGANFQRGSGSIAPSQGLALFEELMGRPVPENVAVIPNDWPRWALIYPDAARAPILRELVQAVETVPASVAVTAQAARMLRTLPPAERLTAVEQWMRQTLSALLRVGEAELTSSHGLAELGFDSMMGIELKRRIERELELNVPLLEILAAASAVQMARRVGELACAVGATDEAPLAVPASNDAQTMVDGMSDDEVERMLKQMASEEPS